MSSNMIEKHLINTYWSNVDLTILAILNIFQARHIVGGGICLHISTNGIQPSFQIYTLCVCLKKLRKGLLRHPMSRFGYMHYKNYKDTRLPFQSLIRGGDTNTLPFYWTLSLIYYNFMYNISKIRFKKLRNWCLNIFRKVAK